MPIFLIDKNKKVKSIVEHGDVDSKHDNRHNLGGNPIARDSLALMLTVPDLGLAGWVYPTVNGEGVAVSAACLFGEGVGTPVYEKFIEKVPEEMDFFNWETGGLTMKIGEPNRDFSVSWRGEKVELDFHYDALHPAYAFSLGPEGSPPYYGSDRIEQHGKIKGKIAAAGKNFEFETFMIKDHSWGPRVWGLNQHHKWIHAVTESVSIHFFEMQSFGRNHLQGFLSKNGVVSQLEAVEYDFELNDDLELQSMLLKVKDMEGRTATAECKVYAHIVATDIEKKSIDNAEPGQTTHYSFDKDLVTQLNEGAMTVVINGEKGIGWAEFAWNKNYLDYARNHSGFRK